MYKKHYFKSKKTCERDYHKDITELQETIRPMIPTLQKKGVVISRWGNGDFNFKKGKRSLSVTMFAFGNKTRIKKISSNITPFELQVVPKSVMDYELIQEKIYKGLKIK